MPNYCLNHLSVDSPMSKELQEYLETNGLSFAKIAPCEETVDVQESTWGTKWDLEPEDQAMAAEALLEGETASFDTAWSPPDGAIQALSKMFPKDRFVLLYVEFGNVFCGKTSFLGGEKFEDVLLQDSGEEFNEFIQEEMGIEPFDDDDTPDE